LLLLLFLRKRVVVNVTQAQEQGRGATKKIPIFFFICIYSTISSGEDSEEYKIQQGISIPLNYRGMQDTQKFSCRINKNSPENRENRGANPPVSCEQKVLVCAIVTSLGQL
jgi:hypothetical protein